MIPPAHGAFGFGAAGVPLTSCHAVEMRFAPAGTVTVVYSGTFTTCETNFVKPLDERGGERDHAGGDGRHPPELVRTRQAGHVGRCRDRGEGSREVDLFRLIPARVLARGDAGSAPEHDETAAANPDGLPMIVLIASVVPPAATSWVRPAYEFTVCVPATTSAFE